MSLKNKPLKCALAVILIYAIGSNNQAMADCIEPEFGGIKNYGLVAKKSDMRELMDEINTFNSDSLVYEECTGNIDGTLEQRKIISEAFNNELRIFNLINSTKKECRLDFNSNGILMVESTRRTEKFQNEISKLNSGDSISYLDALSSFVLDNNNVIGSDCSIRYIFFIQVSEIMERLNYCDSAEHYLKISKQIIKNSSSRKNNTEVAEARISAIEKRISECRKPLANFAKEKQTIQDLDNNSILTENGNLMADSTNYEAESSNSVSSKKINGESSINLRIEKSNTLQESESRNNNGMDNLNLDELIQIQSVLLNSYDETNEDMSLLISIASVSNQIASKFISRFHQNKNIDDAYTAIEQIDISVGIFPDNQIYKLSRGDFYYAIKEYDDNYLRALSSYEASGEKILDSKDSFLGLIDIYLNQELFEDANKIFLKMLLKDPKWVLDDSFDLLISTVLLGSDQTMFLDELVKLSDSYLVDIPNIYLAQSFIHLSQNRQESVIKSFEKYKAAKLFNNIDDSYPREKTIEEYLDMMGYLND